MRTAAVLGMIVCLLAGCKKPAGTPTPASAAPAPSGGGGGANTNFVSGGGAAQNIRKAAQRTSRLNELNTLGQLIEVSYNTNNRMPDFAAFKQELQSDAPNVLAAINDGSIVCCWTAAHEGLWAYEAGSEEAGGSALVTGRASRVDAEEMKRLLGR